LTSYRSWSIPVSKESNSFYCDDSVNLLVISSSP
jgi:hypothetical protein